MTRISQQECRGILEVIIGLSRISLLGKFLLLQIMVPDTIIYQQKARMQLHRKVKISSMKVP